MSDLEQRFTKLKKQFHDLRIMGGEGVIVHGSPTRGYTVEVKSGQQGSGTSDGPPPPPPPPPTGACCIDTDCSILISDDCAAMSGIYQGDGTLCSPNPCGVCPEITLVCDSISSSNTKCGFTEFDCGGGDMTHIYLTRTDTFSGSGGDNSGWYAGACSISGVNTYVFDPTTCGDIPITVTPTIGAVASGCTFVTGPYENPPTYCTDFGGMNLCWDHSPYCTGSFCTPTETYLSYVYYTNGIDCSNATNPDLCAGPVHEGCGDPPCCVNFTADWVLSDEYTTADLIANVEAALPAYSGFAGAHSEPGQGTICEASRNLATNESSYSIERFKPKFTFSPPSEINFTLSYNEHFVPAVGVPSDTPRSTSVGIGNVDYFGPEVLEPSTNGTITITDILCTPV